MGPCILNIFQYLSNEILGITKLDKEKTNVLGKKQEQRI